MPVRLWHCTLCKQAESILVTGFRDGALGVVFLDLPHDMAWMLTDYAALEVILDEDEATIEPYMEESFDADNGNYRQVIYKIPASFLNEHKTQIRILNRDECARAPNSWVAHAQSPLPKSPLAPLRKGGKMEADRAISFPLLTKGGLGAIPLNEHEP